MTRLAMLVSSLILLASLCAACSSKTATPEDAQPVETPDEAPAEVASPPAASVTDLSGGYQIAHTILEMSEEGEEIEHEVNDCVSISQQDPASFSFNISLVFDFDHSCTVSGQAQRISESPTIWSFESSEPEQPCTLTFTLVNETLEVRDQDEHCREYYCGARGFLEFDLPLATRTGGPEMCAPQDL